MSKTHEESAEQTGGIVAFRVPADLLAAVETTAAAEGISKSDVARRALIRDLARNQVAA